jgi:hypothetical protein
MDAFRLRVGSLVEDVISLIVGPWHCLFALPQPYIGQVLADYRDAASGGWDCFRSAEKAYP